jgi:hypothetical protein
MKAFLAAMVSAIVIAFGAVYVLDALQRPADEAFSYSSSVSLPMHGVTHNLVGKDWYSAKEH